MMNAQESQERYAAHERVRLQQKMENAALLNTVAQHLGASWIPNKDEGAYAERGYMQFDGVGGLRLYASIEYTGKRMELSVAWPSNTIGSGVVTWRDVATYEEKTSHPPKLNPTVSIERSPEEIAADLKRRLLPIAREWYAKALARVETNAHATECAIAVALSLTVNQHKNSVKGDGQGRAKGYHPKTGYMGVSVDHEGTERVTFDRSITVNADQAARILAILDETND